MKLPVYYDPDTETLTLSLYIQPKSSRDLIIGLHNNELKMTITAAPTEGSANSHIIHFLSKQFKVSKSSITIIQGQLSRHKTVIISNPRNIPDLVLSLLKRKDGKMCSF